MTTTVYSGRVTNWPLIWVTNVLAVALLIGSGTDEAALVPLLVAAVALLAVNATMTSVRTTAGPNGVVVRYGLLGLPRFRYPAADITSAEAVDVPFAKMGGWGVHWSPWRGTRLTIRSGPALRLERRRGGPVTISAENPRVAASVVNAQRFAA